MIGGPDGLAYPVGVSLREAEAIPRDPLEWRPQIPRESRRAPTIRDPIVEPDWAGRHVLAHVESARAAMSPSVRLVDTFGDDATDDAPEAAVALGRALLAMDAVIDGVLTGQATRGGEGTALILDARLSPLSPILPRAAEIDVPGPVVEDGPTAFVAVDLLRLDGEDLFDLPLLERKRLLESTLRVEELVRVSPFARPPIQTWLASWKAAGFDGVIVKAANSRYRPAALTDEWTVVTKLGR
jgi:bifunctional non-homologous end joining protein LigD